MNTDTELWAIIPEHPNYSISSCGRVKSFKNRSKTGGIMKPRLDRYGYYHIGIWEEDKKHHPTIHRLVAKSFIPNPDNLPALNHIDGNKTNNHISNLEWCSHQHNTQHAHSMGLCKTGGDHCKATHLVLTKDGNILSYYSTSTIMQKCLSVDKKTLQSAYIHKKPIYDELYVSVVKVIPMNTVINKDFTFDKSGTKKLHKPIAICLNGIPIAYYTGAQDLSHILGKPNGYVPDVIRDNRLLLGIYTIKYITRFEYLTNNTILKNIKVAA